MCGLRPVPFRTIICFAFDAGSATHPSGKNKDAARVGHPGFGGRVDFSADLCDSLRWQRSPP